MQYEVWAHNYGEEIEATIMPGYLGYYRLAEGTEGDYETLSQYGDDETGAVTDNRLYESIFGGEYHTFDTFQEVLTFLRGL